MNRRLGAVLVGAIALMALAWGGGCKRKGGARTDAGARGTSPPRPPPQPLSAAAAARLPKLAVVQRQPAEPTVVFRVGFRAGSADDPPGKEGLTCLTARLLKEGGTARRTYAEMLRAFYPMAARLDVSCDKDFTVLTGRVHRDHLDRFVGLFAEILTRPRLAPAAFRRLRRDALDRVTRTLRFDDDEALGKAALADFLYTGHPYRHPAAGTAQGLAAIRLADVRAQLARVLTQPRLLTGVAGGFPAWLPRRLREILARLPRKGPAPAKLPPPGTFQGIQVRVVRKDTRASAISIGLPLSLTRSHPDFPALALAASYLGEHRQSFGVLYRKMRTARGLNYGDYVYAEHFAQQGWGRLPRVNIPRRQQDFTVWIRPVAPRRAHFALRYAVRELRAFLKHGISDAEFQRARSYLVSHSRLWAQTASRRLGYALDSRFYGMAAYPASLVKALRGLTPAAVLAAVRRHWSGKNLKVAVVHPRAEALAKAIRTDAPSPIEYSSPKPPEVLAEDRIVAKYPLHPAKVEVVEATKLFEK